MLKELIRIRVRLTQEHSHIGWPPSSTAGDIVNRHGLVGKSKKPARAPLYTQPFELADRCEIEKTVLNPRLNIV